MKLKKKNGYKEKVNKQINNYDNAKKKNDTMNKTLKPCKMP